ncbi:MAG: NAD-dependent epimerase/dehydratase family protein [Actinomycetota bacterium]|nr:NAD-dependent epimerase/dehydratase family protein [Actinomycetota bacterium]MDA3025800.1 NAD-dependent epimerase/dehydratase family protein [Actinomycetota bacterium]
MRVLVTGGAGFIGTNLARHLLDLSEIDEVRILDDLSTGFRSNLGLVPEAHFIEGSILDLDLLGKAVDGVDSIVHLAARPSVPRSIAEPRAAHEVNATGTLNVLEAARQAGNVHTVVASSSSVYGANPTLPKHEDLATRPVSPYAASKHVAESYTLAWQHSYGLPTLAFRFFNVYGPLQAAGHAYAAAIPTFIDAALNDQPIPLHGDGTQSRDFTFVGTVVAVIARCVAERITSPQPVNLAFGSNITLNEVIEGIGRELDRSVPIDHLPHRPGDVKHSQADNSALLALVPGANPVPFDEGLRATIDWFRSR